MVCLESQLSRTASRVGRTPHGSTGGVSPMGAADKGPPRIDGAAEDDVDALSTPSSRRFFDVICLSAEIASK